MTHHQPTTYKSTIDGNIPPISPFYGKADNRTIETILSNIGSSLFEDSSVTLEEIRAKMGTESKAVISSKRTGQTFVDLEKRNCNRLTFGSPLMVSLKEQIMQILRDDSVKLPVDIDSVELEMSHGDILSYTEGGFFDYHRDGDIRPEREERSTSDQIDQYSMILCLDSGTEDCFHSLSGCTSMYLPTKNLLIFEQELDGTSKHNKIVHMNCHTYPQTRMKNHFLVFPSNALHKSHSIVEGDFKLALKFDLFIKRPKLTQEEAIMHIGRNYYCSCFNCFPQIYTPETKHLVVPTNSKENLEKMLLGVQNQHSLCECNANCCKTCCNCTCAKCINIDSENPQICEYCSHTYDSCSDHESFYDERDEGEHYDEHSDEEWGHEDDSEDDFCNGYEQDDW